MELNKLTNNYNYYKNNMKKKIKVFKQNGLENIINLIDKYINEI